MKKIAILLSGSGNKDGSEIHEASICMSSLELASKDVELKCISINKDQYRVLNFITGTPLPEKRNTLIESARIARGKIYNIKDINPLDIDALVIIGGLGAVTNLSDYLYKKQNMSVDSEVKSFLEKLHSNKKIIGAICIAPIIIAKIFSDLSPKITLGESMQDNTVLDAIDFGANVISCSSSDIVIDEKNQFVTTPAFMNPGSLRDIYPGINKLAQYIVSKS